MSDVNIGTRLTSGGAEPVTIHTTDRRQGVHLLGKPGTGKSTLILNMVVLDMREGNSVTLIDAHGDLVEEVLRHIPRRRTNDGVITT